MFDRTKKVLEAALPASAYKAVYTVAWNTFLFFDNIKDRLSFAFGSAWYSLTGNREAAAKAKILGTIKSYSMVGTKGLHVTYDAVRDVVAKQVPGDLVECGVARGGSSAMMALVAREFDDTRTSWLFDTFEGLPPAGEEDDYVAPDYAPTDRHASVVIEGFCLGTKEEVGGLMIGKLGFEEDKIKMVQGLFQDTLPVTRDSMGPISVLRLDGDWYDSTMCCFNNLYEKVSSGGYVVIDDYISVGGCKKATDEYIATHNLSVELVLDGRGGAYFQKP